MHRQGPEAPFVEEHEHACDDCRDHPLDDATRYSRPTARSTNVRTPLRTDAADRPAVI